MSYALGTPRLSKKGESGFCAMQSKLPPEASILWRPGGAVGSVQVSVFYGSGKNQTLTFPGYFRQRTEEATFSQLTWNSVVFRIWRPSGLQQEATSPAEPSSILQCHSGCSSDQTLIHKRNTGVQTSCSRQEASLRERMYHVTSVVQWLQATLPGDFTAGHL